MARLLSVVWYKVLPAYFGGQKGIAEFNEYLSGYHTVYCLCSNNNQPSGKESYQVLPLLPVGRMQIVKPGAIQTIINKVRQLRVSHVILEHSYYGLAGILIKRSMGKKLIVHAHNIEAIRFRSLGKWWWRMLWILEKNTHRIADLNLFKTREDMDFAMERFGLDYQKCMVVPYGLSRTFVPTPEERQSARKELEKAHQIQPDEKILLFSGSLDYAPNAQALRFLVQTLIPMLESMTNQPFRLIVCGRIIHEEYHHLFDLQHERYTYAGLVDDIDTYMLGADIFLNPVNEGGGIKVKLMEALSFNLPVVSTAHGAIGVDTRLTGDKLQIAADGDWTQFCHCILKAWENRSNTPAAFYDQYHWSRVILPVAEKIASL